MKNKKLLAGICIMTLTMVMMLCSCQNDPQTIQVTTGEDGVITVTAENAAKDSGASGYADVQTDEQVIEVDSDLEEGSSIEIIIKDTADGKTHGQLVVTGDADYEFAVPAGEYVIEFIASEGATGTLGVSVDDE